MNKHICLICILLLICVVCAVYKNREAFVPSITNPGRLSRQYQLDRSYGINLDIDNYLSTCPDCE